MMPTFTYKTMITPSVGPPNNGITYGAEMDLNSQAEAFTPSMPCDKLMGIVPETLRNLPHAKRTSHPIQSFAGISRRKTFSDANDSKSPGANCGAGRSGWMGLVARCGSYGQHQHSLRGKTRGTKTISSLGTDSESHRGMSRLSRRLSRVQCHCIGTCQRYTGNTNRKYRRSSRFIESIVCKSDSHLKEKTRWHCFASGAIANDAMR